MKISTAWLKDYVVFKPPLESLAERLTLAGLEVKAQHPALNGKDVVFETEITSNRPDWLSHIGVAREVAAVDNLMLKVPEIETIDSRQLPPGWKVEIREPEGGPFYTAVLIEGLEMAQTPDFIRDRLEACGHRSVNLIVDITNYVLLETGQPLHAFDADLLRGKQVNVRRARKDEKFIALNGNQLTLAEKDLVIADADRPVALAGIMGGKETEVSERTKSILLESAYFNPAWVRQSSKRHGLMTDSSYRFERKVDPEGVEFARQRALYLIRRYASPRFVSTALKKGNLPARKVSKIHLAGADVRKVLGIDIKASIVPSILSRLGLDVKTRGTDSWEVTAPSFRPDIAAPVDLIEEIARIYGFDKIPETLPLLTPSVSVPQKERETQKQIRAFLAGAGLYETVTFSLIPELGLNEEILKTAIYLENPMNKELRWLRMTMTPSLLNVVRRNESMGAKKIALFEIANLYRLDPEEKKPLESKTLAIALTGLEREKDWLDTERPTTFYDLKGKVLSLLQHLGVEELSLQTGSHMLMAEGTAQQIYSGEILLGSLGEVAPAVLKQWDLEKNVYIAELSVVQIAACRKKIKMFHEMPRYPAIERDLAVVVEESVSAGEIMRSVEDLNDGLIKEIRVFDFYRGGRIPKGYKNLAFRITYQADDRTLVSEDIQKLHDSIASRIAAQFQASFQA